MIRGPATLLRASRPAALPAPGGPGLHPVPGYRLTVLGMTPIDGAWVPQACTLPSAERPLRTAEFDDLLATALRDQTRLAPTWLRWELDPAAETTARDLTRRESECCSFFAFTVAAAAGSVRVDVRVPAERVEVLDALAARAAAGMAA